MKDFMTCEAFEGLLPRYLEEEATAAERMALEAHAAGCAECGAMLAELNEITREAAALPVLEPSRDLWDGIASRIEAPAIPLDSRRAAAVPAVEARPRSWRTMRLAAAAAVLMVATAGITNVITRQAMARQMAPSDLVDVAPEPGTLAANAGSENPADAVTGTPGVTQPGASAPASPVPGGRAPRVAPAPASAATETLVAGPARAEAVYDQEIALLQEMLDRRRAELDPATTVVLENNLRIIDRAIRDSRTALARDPASGFLTDQLTMALDKKLQLMRTVAKLPSRT